MLVRIGRQLRQNLVAYLALFVALGGTSLAAVNALVPKNSVGSAQVINGSLQKGDLSKKAAAALKGSRGPGGLAGPPWPSFQKAGPAPITPTCPARSELCGLSTVPCT